MVTYHPSYLLHNPSKASKRKVWEDMLMVMEKLEMPISEKQQGFFSSLDMVCKKALLVLAGSPPSVEILRWWVEETDCSITVDGGWRCFDWFTSQVLIDADSFPSFEKVADKETKVSVHRIIDQETTDFEKALDWLDSRTSPEEIVILGGLGGRSDHLCTNLMIASRIDPQRLVVFDGRGNGSGESLLNAH